jgi:hypothetical protein
LPSYQDCENFGDETDVTLTLEGHEIQPDPSSWNHQVVLIKAIDTRELPTYLNEEVDRKEEERRIQDVNERWIVLEKATAHKTSKDFIRRLFG